MICSTVMYRYSCSRSHARLKKIMWPKWRSKTWRREPADVKSPNILSPKKGLANIQLLLEILLGRNSWTYSLKIRYAVNRL